MKPENTDFSEKVVMENSSTELKEENKKTEPSELRRPSLHNDCVISGLPKRLCSHVLMSLEKMPLIIVKLLSNDTSVKLYIFLLSKNVNVLEP